MWSPLTDYDVYLFRKGEHFRLYRKLGAHLVDGGAHFAVWAPNASYVSVIGSFNDWDPGANPLRPREDGSGIWEGFVEGVRKGDLYKYRILSRYGGYAADK
ncbi:MAG: hypothetical protein QXR87_06940, partial [Candidatus Hadarchaeales archaeon]